MTKREQVKQFMRWYDGSLADTASCEDAYKLTEATWIAEYGERFYKNYNSFRTGRHYFIKFTSKGVKPVK